jgi:hypothetical protein
LRRNLIYNNRTGTPSCDTDGMGSAAVRFVMIENLAKFTGANFPVI